MLPELVGVCDILHVYDNTGDRPFRIFKKRKDVCFYAENEFWDRESVLDLTGVEEAERFPGA